MSMEILEKNLAATVDHFRKLYSEEPDYELKWPIYYLFDEDGDFTGMAPVMMPKEMWHLVRDHLASHSEKLHIHSFIFVSEAWGTEKRVSKEELEKFEKDEEGLPIMGSLEDDPDSYECLTLTVGDRAGNRISALYRLGRTGREPLTLEKEWRSDRPEGGAPIFKWDLWDRPSLRGTVH